MELLTNRELIDLLTNGIHSEAEIWQAAEKELLRRIKGAAKSWTDVVAEFVEKSKPIPKGGGIHSGAPAIVGESGKEKIAFLFDVEAIRSEHKEVLFMVRDAHERLDQFAKALADLRASGPDKLYTTAEIKHFCCKSVLEGGLGLNPCFVDEQMRGR